MFINQHQQDEFELALSCVARPIHSVSQIKQHAVSRYGLTREQTIKLATEFYRDVGHANRKEFFRKHGMCTEVFYRNVRWFSLDIKRYYRIDGGPIYAMQWLHPQETMKRDPRISQSIIMKCRNNAFLKEHRDTRELFVELANIQYCHYYKRPKQFFQVLKTVDISRGTYYHRIKKYGIKAEVFMSIDNRELFPVKCKSLNNSD
ncbi:hypothetical protein FQY15_19545 [Salmonella enterica]|nr:hypothetical protein [Salmonella enterica]ECU8346863.1 hypothetical protein [Salmonella enterica subsp. enterica serovar Javiana]